MYKKSSVLICRKKAMAHADLPVFTVNCSIIGESDKVKYIGHIICNDGMVWCLIIQHQCAYVT